MSLQAQHASSSASFGDVVAVDSPVGRTFAIFCGPRPDAPGQAFVNGTRIVPAESIRPLSPAEQDQARVELEFSDADSAQQFADIFSQIPFERSAGARLLKPGGAGIARNGKPSKHPMDHLGVLDVETTDTSERAGVLEIGIVKLIDPERTFYLRCRPFEGCSINPEAMKVNGRVLDDPRELALPSESEAVIAARRWCEANGIKLATGQNPTFDTRQLAQAESRISQVGRPYFAHRGIDLGTLTMALALQNGDAIPEYSFSADRTYEYLGALPEPKPHRGIQGAWMEAHATRRVLTELVRPARPGFSLPGRAYEIAPLTNDQMDSMHEETVRMATQLGWIPHRKSWDQVQEELTAGFTR